MAKLVVLLSYWFSNQRVSELCLVTLSSIFSVFRGTRHGGVMSSYHVSHHAHKLARGVECNLRRQNAQSVCLR